MDDQLLQQVAEVRGMPASLVERSAQARADKTGTTVEAVLREWLGEAGVSTDKPEAVESEPITDAPPSAVVDAVPSVAVTTDDLVRLAAETRRMPTKLILASAEARAEHSGLTLELVLADWAGVDLDELKDRSASAGNEPATPATSEEATTPVAAPATPAPAPVAAAPVAAGAELSMDELLAKVAEAKGMPAALAQRSAEARSKKTGEPIEAVLAEWAGIDPTALSQAAPQPEAAPATPAPAPVAAAPVAAGAALSMDELLAKVTEAKGMPAALAQRSAEARSKKTGEPVEAVLAEWAGIDPTALSQAAPQPEAAPAPAAPPPAPAAEIVSDGSDATPEVVDTGSPAIEIIEASTQPGEMASVGDAGTPTKRGSYPMWLAAAFILIPLLAVTYILVSPNGPDCGSGGQLLVDPSTGEAVNCDGGTYGETTVDNFAAGGGLYAQCAACHSGDGSGGVGPAFAAGAVLVTFPGGSCSDQISWVSLGTAGWPDPTYGATNKQVGGVGLMPGFGASLTEQQVAQVVLYERVAFGGQPLEEAEVDCGLVEASEG